MDGWRKERNRSKLEQSLHEEVEVFDLTGHPKAKRAYGWSHREGKNDDGERFVAVLEIPPVVSPITAVRASIIADKKKRTL